jgi:hypothetical protein
MTSDPEECVEDSCFPEDGFSHDMLAVMGRVVYYVYEKLLSMHQLKQQSTGKSKSPHSAFKQSSNPDGGGV